MRKGAGCIICSTSKVKNKKIVKVKNPISFLNYYAKLKTRKHLAKIIAITGSTGKTSTKNLTKNLLQNFGNTYSLQSHLIIIWEFRLVYPT